MTQALPPSEITVVSKPALADLNADSQARRARLPRTQIYPKLVHLSSGSTATLERVISTDGGEIVALYGLEAKESSEDHEVFGDLPLSAQSRYRPAPMGCWASFGSDGKLPKLWIGADREWLRRLSHCRQALIPEASSVVDAVDVRGLALGLLRRAS